MNHIVTRPDSDLSQLKFSVRQPAVRSEHFPYFVLDGYAPPALYQQLVAEFPTAEEMTKGHQFGKRFISNRDLAGREDVFFAGKPAWQSVISFLRSREFLSDVEGFLRPYLVRHRWVGAYRRWREGIDVNAPFERPVELTYEFSGMPAGSYINPHTDKPSKLATFVWHFPEPGWRPEDAGPTLFLKAKRSRHNTNWANYKLPFEATELLERSDVAPNRLTAFVKTRNSWHAVPSIECRPGVYRRAFIFNYRYPVAHAANFSMRAFESLHRRSEKWRFGDYVEVNQKPDYE